MLLRKIEGEKNVQNCGFYAKLRQWWHASTAVVTNSHSLICRRYDTSPMSKFRRRWPGIPNGRSKARNLRFLTLVRSQITLRRRLRGWRWRLRGWWQWAARLTAAAPRLTAASGDSSSGTFADVKHIVVDDQATLMVDRNSATCLFTFARSQLTLPRLLRSWRILFKRHVADIENIAGGGPAMTRIDRSSAITNIYVYEIK